MYAPYDIGGNVGGARVPLGGHPVLEVAPDFDFGIAISMLKAGNKVARAGWNGKGMWLMLQVPNKQSKMSLPYIYMRTVQGDLVPWLASQTDMLAEDWELVA